MREWRQNIPCRRESGTIPFSTAAAKLAPRERLATSTVPKLPSTLSLTTQPSATVEAVLTYNRARIAVQQRSGTSNQQPLGHPVYLVIYGPPTPDPVPQSHARPPAPIALTAWSLHSDTSTLQNFSSRTKPPQSSQWPRTLRPLHPPSTQYTRWLPRNGLF
jgi:hypothetical protein